MSDEFNSTEDQKAPKSTSSSCLCGGVGPSITQLVQAMAPPEAASDHFRRSRIEMLKGLRQLLDQRIEALSKDSGSKGTKFTVE